MACLLIQDCRPFASLPAITFAGAHDAASLLRALGPSGSATAVEPGDPTPEDVFTALTRAATPPS
jgi:hypothetical protein